MQEKIIQLRKENKTYDEIANILNCTKSLVCYYLGKNQKEKSKIRTRKRRKNNPLQIKLEFFISKYKRQKTRITKNETKTRARIRNKFYCFIRGNNMSDITLEDVMNKIGNDPKCYLTGRKIDLSKPKTYQLDHIIPRSKGGTNTIDNLGITCSDANQCKRNLSPEEFIKLCKEILENSGYKVIKN